MQLPAHARQSANEARAHLLEQGWTEVGQGDWSWVLADPTDTQAARVTPFDPAYRMFADDCLHGPTNPWLPRIEAIYPVGRNGYVVLMERLWPAHETAAQTLCAAIGIANQVGWDNPIQNLPPAEDHDLLDLRRRLTALLATGSAGFRLWGGSDIRAGNIMVTARGQLKVVDPLFVKGLEIFAAIRDGQNDRLADFTRDQLEDYLTIPVFPLGPETDALRAKLNRMKLRET